MGKANVSNNVEKFITQTVKDRINTPQSCQKMHGGSGERHKKEWCIVVAKREGHALQNTLNMFLTKNDSRKA